MLRVSTFVLLPQGLPWADGAQLSVPEGGAEIRLAFHRTRPLAAGVEEADAIVAEVLRASDPGAPSAADSSRPARPLDLTHTTVVEIATTQAEQGADPIHEAVHRSIDALHIVDRAAVVATGSARRPVGPADVWPVVHAVLRSADDEVSSAQTRVIVLGEGKPDPVAPPPLDHGALLAAVDAIVAADPISRWKEWRFAAAASRQEVRIADAVVQLCVAIEVLVDAALGLELYETGTAPDRAAAALHCDPSAQLSESLDVDPRGWLEAATLRSALLQCGKGPRPEELEAAFDGADRLRDELVGRALDHRSGQPRTALVLSGECWSPLGDPAPEMRAWVAGYAPWRAAVAAAGGGAAGRLAAT